MKRTSILKLSVVLVAAVAAAIYVGASAAPASAAFTCTGAACPPSTRGVVPAHFDGNPSCADVDGALTTFEVKFDPVDPMGSTMFSFNGGSSTGNVAYTYNATTGEVTFQVTNTGAVPAVVAFAILKGGPGANVYDYTAFPAGGVLSDGNMFFAQGSSHISICLRPAITLAVGTNSIRAVRSGKQVTLRWKTSSEANVLGYRVYRKTGAKKVQLTRGIIPAASAISSKSSHAYSFRARLASAKLAATSRYVLVEIHRDGTRTSYRPVRAVPAT